MLSLNVSSWAAMIASEFDLGFLLLLESARFRFRSHKNSTRTRVLLFAFSESKVPTS
jgi:hypothetical protein